MTVQRVTLHVVAVARALNADPDGEHYGFDVARRTGLAGGTVQPILARLEASGWLVSRWEDIDEHKEGRRRRRLYRVTDVGRREIAALLRERSGATP